MFFSPLTIAFNCFSMVLGSLNHHHKMFSSPQTIGFNGFSMVLGSFNHWFQWFSMVMDHWSNDAMVSMYCSSLLWHVLSEKKSWSLVLPNMSKIEAEITNFILCNSLICSQSRSLFVLCKITDQEKNCSFQIWSYCLLLFPSHVSYQDEFWWFYFWYCCCCCEFYKFWEPIIFSVSFLLALL